MRDIYIYREVADLYYYYYHLMYFVRVSILLRQYYCRFTTLNDLVPLVGGATWL